MGGLSAEKVPEQDWEGQAQQGSGEGSGEGGVGGGSGEGSGRQCQVRFNRVPEKVPKKVWEALEHAEVFPALGFAACFRKIGKNKMLRLLVIPPKLIVFFTNGCLGMRIPVRCVVSAGYALPHAIQRPATARAAIDLCKEWCTPNCCYSWLSEA